MNALAHATSSAISATVPAYSSLTWRHACLLSALLGLTGICQASSTHAAEVAKPQAHQAAAAEHGHEKAPAPSGSAASGTATKSSAAKAPASVPMSALRELLDQTIADVRARQDTAAVVRVSPASKPRTTRARAPATQPALHGTHTLSATPASAEHPLEAAAHDVHKHWTYEGDTAPEKWGELDPKNRLCSVGQRQSPIDIRDGIKVELEPIQFDYRATQFRVIDNGHTVQVNLEPGNSIMVGGRRYDLVQFHFHRPSEERIHGRQFDMVAHLVHKDVQGRLAVVAVLMAQGTAHPMVQLVWNNLPLEKNIEQYAPVMMDMTRMLPEQRDYYTYMGSLTTPPCSEGVLWMVMKNPATMSAEQMSIFARLYPMNARPIQSTAGRLIKESQ